MSEIKVNKISPRANCGTVQLGDSGDTITIPAGATITNNGTQTGFGRTGAVDWQTTIKTGDFTAVSGEGYFVNTTSGEVTVTLPSSPSAGAIVSVKDYANTFDTSNLIIGRNGSNIGGLAVDSTISTEGIAITLVYADATKGWLVTEDGLQSSAPGPLFIAATGGTTTECGDFKIHTFTGPGTFCVSAVGNSAGSNAVEYLVVAGGGGGGSGNPTNNGSGGAGAGGFRFASPSLAPVTYPAKPLAAPAGLPVAVQGYPISVGGGGSTGAPANGGKGVNSVFSTITATGGGGGHGTGPYTLPSCISGGSGGGARGGANNQSGGTGNTPSVSPAQGTNGGASPTTPPDRGGGGGGGALVAGGTGIHCVPRGGNGGTGAGLPTAFGANGVPCGSFRYYAGGGGGGSGCCSPGSVTGVGVPGLGGGGAGGDGACGGPPLTGGAATINTGGGGGGAGGNPPKSNVGGAGGSGIVVIRYKFQ